MRILTAFSILLVSFLLPSIGTRSFAETKISLGNMSIDEASQIELTSKSMSYNTETKITEFKDEVVVKYGDLKLTSSKLTIFNANDLEFIAAGSLTLSSGNNIITGETAYFTMKNQTVTISGNVAIAKDENIISGDQLVINLKDGIARIVGSVKTVIIPKGD